MRKLNQVCMLVDTLHKIVMLLHTSRQNKSINYCFSSKNGPLMFLLFLVTINIGLKNGDLWSQYLWLRKLTRFCKHLNNYYNSHVCLSIRVSSSLCPKTNCNVYSGITICPKCSANPITVTPIWKWEFENKEHPIRGLYMTFFEKFLFKFPFSHKRF